jgi:hypothetical protein
MNKEKLRIDLLRRKTWERRPDTRPTPGRDFGRKKAEEKCPGSRLSPKQPHTAQTKLFEISPQP